jgi:hypothetical protein
MGGHQSGVYEIGVLWGVVLYSYLSTKVYGGTQ